MKPLYLFFMLAALLPALGPVAAGALTLEEAVATALRNNPHLQQQRLQQQLTTAADRATRARDWGRVSLVSSYTHYNKPRTLLPMTPTVMRSDPAAVATTEDLGTAAIVYEVELFTGFAQTSALRISELQQQLAATTTRLEREQLIYNVKTLYMTIIAQQRQRRAQQQYLSALLRLQQNVRQRVKLGKLALVDQLKAAADVEKARASVRAIAANITALRAALTTVLGGNDPGKLQEAALDEGSISTLEQPPAAPATLKRLQRAQLAVEQSRHKRQEAAAVNYPHLVFSGAYGQNFGPNDDSNVNSGDWEHHEVWQVGLNLRWQLFDFGGSDATIRQAALRERHSRLQQRETALQLQQQLAEAQAQINSAADSYASAVAECKLTAESARIEKLRFDNGAATINDLLYAKARDAQAVSRRIAAACAYRNARFYLDYLLEQGEQQ